MPSQLTIFLVLVPGTEGPTNCGNVSGYYGTTYYHDTHHTFINYCSNSKKVNFPSNPVETSVADIERYGLLLL